MLNMCAFRPYEQPEGTQGSDQPFVRKNEELVTRKLVDDLLKFECLDGVPNALEAIASAFLDGDHQRTILAPQVAKLGKPIRIVWGARDRIIPVAHSNALGDSAKIYLFPNAGHMVQMEAANEVNRILLG